jgi:hypothetical protein
VARELPLVVGALASLEFPDGQKVVCDQEGLGDNPWADDVIRELQV